jgi:ceramide glucosyltransferase
MIATALFVLAYGVGAAALGYAGLADWRLRRFARATPSRTAFAPAVSVLKPLCGLEPELYENLRSFFQLDYPRVQIVFGVRDAGDPARHVAERLKVEFPQSDVAIVVESRQHGSNPKLNNLINMMPAARHDVLVLSDSDIRVPPDYLARLIAPLSDLRVGAVTCAYTAHPVTPGLAARMAALQINDGFFPSVLMASILDEMGFCMGSTIALRRDALCAIGGFCPLSNVLADDYEIGRRLVDRGYRVALSDCVVDTVTTEIDMKDLLLHELRWSRTIRTVRPLGFAGLFITQTVSMCVLAALALALTGGGRVAPITLVTMGLLTRTILHFDVVRRFAAPRGTIWLVPIREALSLGIWAASFMGRRVTWRGRRFSVRQGRLLEKKGFALGRDS